MRRMREINSMSADSLASRIQENHGELGRLYAMRSKGTLRKESGKIRAIKKEIARMLTRLNAMEDEQ